MKIRTVNNRLMPVIVYGLPPLALNKGKSKEEWLFLHHEKNGPLEYLCFNLRASPRARGPVRLLLLRPGAPSPTSSVHPLPKAGESEANDGRGQG